MASEEESSDIPLSSVDEMEELTYQWWYLSKIINSMKHMSIITLPIFLLREKIKHRLDKLKEL